MRRNVNSGKMYVATCVPLCIRKKTGRKKPYSKTLF